MKTKLIISAFLLTFVPFLWAENNLRLSYGMLPGIIAFVGIVITLGVVLQYISYMTNIEIYLKL